MVSGRPILDADTAGTEGVVVLNRAAAAFWPGEDPLGKRLGGALIGIFGLVSYTVAQRHREIGLRVALGATYSRLVALILRQALVPAVLGIVAGTVGALAASRLLAAFLFEVPPTDPATFSAAIGLFFCAAFVAALVPALKSFRVDPAGALRHE
jgi:ABC-type antimicrobial peptide transport system permease subunit